MAAEDDLDSDDDKASENAWQPIGADAVTGEPVTLKAAIGRWTTFFALLCVGAIWNGIVGVGVWTAVDSVRDGSPQWGLILFLSPFVAIGLALLWGIVYTFLQTFNPVPTMTLSAGAAPLGAELDLTWQFSGLTSRLQRVVIELRGQEEATYRRGTSNITDKHTFATIKIVDTTDSIEIESGSTTLQVPSTTMHSFDSGRNKVQWSLHIHGEIRAWPDVNEEYPIIVLPHVGILDLQR